jgi:hypothetical protein
MSSFSQDSRTTDKSVANDGWDIGVRTDVGWGSDWTYRAQVKNSPPLAEENFAYEEGIAVVRVRPDLQLDEDGRQPVASRIIEDCFYELEHGASRKVGHVTERLDRRQGLLLDLYDAA